MIACTVRMEFQARFFDLLTEPCACSQVGFAKRGTVYPSVAGSPNLSQFVECR